MRQWFFWCPATSKILFYLLVYQRSDFGNSANIGDGHKVLWTLHVFPIGVVTNQTRLISRYFHIQHALKTSWKYFQHFTLVFPNTDLLEIVEIWRVDWEQIHISIQVVVDVRKQVREFLKMRFDFLLLVNVFMQQALLDNKLNIRFFNLQISISVCYMA